MTNAELRNHPGYIEAMEKIKNYSPGFKFTIRWNLIPRAKANGLRFVLQDARDAGLIESISDDWGWDRHGEFTMVASTYQRTNAPYEGGFVYHNTDSVEGVEA